MNSRASVLIAEHPHGALSTGQTIENTDWDWDNIRQTTDAYSQTYLTKGFC